jgi:hypothetical protein
MKFDEGPLTSGLFVLRKKRRTFCDGRCTTSASTAVLPGIKKRAATRSFGQNSRYKRVDITEPWMPQCSTPNAKIVSNKNRQKKFLLKLIFV